MRLARLLGLLFLLAATSSVAACSAGEAGIPLSRPTATPSPTSAPTSEPTRAALGPVLTLSPNRGGPRTRISISGKGFPGGARVGIHLGPSQTGPTAETYAEANADATGAFTVAFLMPGAWNNGEPITDSELVIQAASEDSSVRATAEFGFVPEVTLTAPSPTDTEEGATPALDPRIAQAATDTVNNFLSSLQKDPSGKSSLVYLSTRLQSKAKQGQGVASLLGVQTTYPSFQITSVEPSDVDSSVVVRASLQSSSILLRVFLVQKDKDTWKIADIAEE